MTHPSTPTYFTPLLGKNMDVQVLPTVLSEELGCKAPAYARSQNGHLGWREFIFTLGS
jgi:hypothetical protein